MSYNIDFATFTTFSGTLPRGDTTVALTPGKWFITAFGTTLVNGSDTPGIHFVKNGTVIKESFSGNTPSPIWQNISVQDIVEIDDGDTFVIRFGYGIALNRTGYCCIRVG